jgi:hypothetical protein
LVLAWDELAFAELAHVRNYLQAHEYLAYEDRLWDQLRLLEEATATLWHLRFQIALTDL